MSAEAFFTPRRLRVAFRLAAVAFGLLQVWSARGRNLASGDATAYLDIADAYGRADWAQAVNAFWSPLYSWLLAIPLALFRPAPRHELLLVSLTNFLIYLAALACFEYFLRGLARPQHAPAPREVDDTRGSKDDENNKDGNDYGNDYGELRGDVNDARLQRGDGDDGGLQRGDGKEGARRALPEPLPLVAGYSLFIWSSLSLNYVPRVTPDLLVSALVFAASGLTARVRAGRTGRKTFALLGLVLGLGYLAKAVMFPLAFVFAASAALAARGTRRGVARALLSLAVFALVSAPFVAAVSRAKGRLTFGESGRLNYAWHVSGAKQFIHWQGDSAERPAHPTRKISDSPAVFEFAAPFDSTYPPWYDPSHWNEGRAARFDPAQQARAFARNLRALLNLYSPRSFITGFALALLLLVAALRPPRLYLRRLRDNLPLTLPALAALALYLLVHVETRYLAPFAVLLCLGLLTPARPRAIGQRQPKDDDNARPMKDDDNARPSEDNDLPNDNDAHPNDDDSRPSDNDRRPSEDRDLPSDNAYRPSDSDGARQLLLARLAALAIVAGLLVSVGASSLRAAYDVAVEIARGGAGRDGGGGGRGLHAEVAEGLRRLGVGEGERVGSIGETMLASWPRLARVRVVAEIPHRVAGVSEPPTGEVEKFWSSDAATRARSLAAFERAGARLVVADRAPEHAAAEGWQQIGSTKFYCRFLR